MERLYCPLKLGHDTITHRVGMAPLTRYRSPNHEPLDFVETYYSQRASGGLIISEATFISKAAGGYPNAPGIYTKEQIARWKKVTAAVRAKNSVFYCQLWAIGRANKGQEPNVPIVSSGNLSFPGGKVPTMLSVPEINQFINDYHHAAKCAIEAGFHGCELHAAHGYLPDQFLQLSSNNRTDQYGGSLQNRARFLFQALGTIVDAIGQERTAIRLSPFIDFQGMGHEDPFKTWLYVCFEIQKRFPRLAYVSITDPRLDNNQGGNANAKKYSCDPFRCIFRGMDPSLSSGLSKDATLVFPEPTKTHPTVFFTAGGYAASDAKPHCERTGDIVGYGRFFIANPDLPLRIKHGLELNPYDRKTFYTQTEEGYTTYPFARIEESKL
jgi:2,4-dienoyl-CoA reductase-like NADH-dependent reductase (Old Yellow Enzyme family)